MSMEVFYFGAPGNGFESYPAKMVSSLSKYDQSHLKYGEIECKYNKIVNSVSFVYSIYGLGGKGDGGYRKGRNFGVGLRLDGYELIESERIKLYEFLHRFIYQGVNQEAVGVFLPNKGQIVDYAIRSFKERPSALDRLSSTLIEQFKSEFGDSLIAISDSSSYVQELDPQKIKERRVNYEKSEFKGEDSRRNKKKHSELDSLGEEMSGDKYQRVQESKTRSNYFAWWPLLIFPAIVISGYNFYQMLLLKEQVKRNAIEISEVSKVGENNQKSYSIVKRIKENENFKYFISYDNLSKSANVKSANSIMSVEDFVNSLIRVVVNSNEMPAGVSNSELHEFIVEHNSKDLKAIEKELEVVADGNNEGILLVDLLREREIIIWKK